MEKIKGRVGPTTQELKNKVREFFESEKETIIDDLTELFSVSPPGIAYLRVQEATGRNADGDEITLSKTIDSKGLLLESKDLNGTCLMDLSMASTFMYSLLKYCQEGE